MLDYVANAMVCWPLETIRAEFKANHEYPQRVTIALLGDNDTDSSVLA